MKEFVVYTGMRLFLFILALLVVSSLWVLFDETPQWLLVLIVSLVLSGVASYFLLRRQREAFARVVEARAQRASTAFEQMKAKEDDD